MTTLIVCLSTLAVIFACVLLGMAAMLAVEVCEEVIIAKQDQ